MRRNRPGGRRIFLLRLDAHVLLRLDAHVAQVERLSWRFLPGDFCLHRRTKSGRCAVPSGRNRVRADHRHGGSTTVGRNRLFSTGAHAYSGLSILMPDRQLHDSTMAPLRTASISSTVPPQRLNGPEKATTVAPTTSRVAHQARALARLCRHIHAARTPTWVIKEKHLDLSR
jgi:hypothetical protein